MPLCEHLGDSVSLGALAQNLMYLELMNAPPLAETLDVRLASEAPETLDDRSHSIESIDDEVTIPRHERIARLLAAGCFLLAFTFAVLAVLESTGGG